VELYDELLALDRSPRFSIRAHQVRKLTGDAEPFQPLLDFLEERPLDSDMRIYLARAYNRADDRDKAIEQYEKVMEQDADNFVAANDLAYFYSEAGDARAEKLARHAFELRPENSSVMDTLGWILVKNGKLEEGIELLRRALSARRDDPDISYHLASGLAAAGETAEAKDVLETIIARNAEFSSKAEAEALLSSL
jgi:Tfp pilus assembly protein PilF